MRATYLAPLIALSIAILGSARAVCAAPWVWPLSGSAIQDEMNTSFGPRINYAAWDFHDGIDFPAPVGTPVHAVAGGVIHRAGPAGTDGYSSRHVVLRVDDLNAGTIYVVHLHLSSIAPGIVQGAVVIQGTVLGAVGDDGAAYSHLHFETRLGSPYESASVHPLHFLPYADSANFTPPTVDRFQVLQGGPAARFRFAAADRNEGDLRRVEVDLRSGLAVLATRIVDVDDKTTVNEGLSDALEWVDDIALEGYQTSDLAGAGRNDLEYGILVRMLPPGCDSLSARVIDVAGNVIAGPVAPVPALVPFGEHVDFEDGLMPPAGWVVRTSSSGTGTSVGNDLAAAHAGLRGMRATDLSTTEGGTQRAAIERPLPPGHLGFIAEAWIHPVSLGLAASQNVYSVELMAGTGVSAAAAIRNDGGSIVGAIAVKKPDGSIGVTAGTSAMAIGAWRRMSLELLRLGTRETTAVLYLDGIEETRRTWDGTAYEPDGVRAGIGLSSTGASAELQVDEVWLGDGGRLSLPSFAPGSVPDGLVTPGAPLRATRSGADVTLAWSPSCNVGTTDFAIYEGPLGSFGAAVPSLCSTAQLTAATFAPGGGDRFYLVVPRSTDFEGSYGVDGAGDPRPPSAAACVPQLPGGCP